MVSTPLLTDEHLDVPLDYEGVGAAGSMLGTKALQSFDETTCVVRRCCAGPSSTSTSPAASAPRAVKAPSGWCRCWGGSRTARASRKTSSPCSTCPTTSSAVRSAPSPTVRPPDHLLGAALPGRVPGPPREGRLPVRPIASTLFATPLERAHDLQANPPAGEVEKVDLITVTIDDIGQGPQEHPADPGGGEDRDPDPAVLRPPAARPGRRLPPVPGRDPRRRATAGGCRSRRRPARSRSPRAWRSGPS